MGCRAAVRALLATPRARAGPCSLSSGRSRTSPALRHGCLEIQRGLPHDGRGSVPRLAFLAGPSMGTPAFGRALFALR